MKRILPLLCTLILLLSACAPAVPGEPSSVPAAQVLFTILRADGTTYDVTLEALKSLPPAQLTVEGKVEEGPKLLDVLALAGVTEFNEVTMRGSSSPCTLRRDQVDENTLLDFTNRGTMKLATTHIPKADWTKDIAEITVK